ncbi:dihydroorotate dehydrogenase [Porphyromonas cangingivalis]|uniref:Dihydroorotate dehydrogenase n=1 Tax=Porphyromonas cangingivalis TaxID=36874 RepID=A0A1T4KSI6_PORCN|nr:dihydroorotate dehydrogenase [Porphyromonas cangingivalis]SJZ45287.1 dihydroorotate dehydrogenase (NAD+) catalytic subunit [Porphyromonas cangingivalis]SPY34784.1 Dihydroorotate dehydrogenase B (NAD(+)), catalytic subunit [Porphyromonas cangingivalis]VEJ02415.1 Dihydroorotate dehydrogenase B (NAD(+)), catalytic subunit [Porphyromonas cangingivalis]
MERNLKVKIGALELKNPVTTASGTFGDGILMNDVYDVSRLGAIFAKGTTLHHREGNPPCRMAETASGMLNAVGLQNKGVHYFAEHIYPEATALGTEIIVNVSGSTIEDYLETTEVIAGLDKIKAIELNISCPNVKEGGMAFGVTCEGISSIVKAVREVYPKTLIVKLSPNVSDIALMARTAEANGADAVSLVNTFLGMAVDAERRRPKLSTVTGGLSGPCIKPIALRMVWQVAKAVNIPVVGLGGICTWQDAIEFMLCGASAIQVGTYNFVDPLAPLKILSGIEDYMQRHGVTDINDLVGALEV